MTPPAAEIDLLHPALSRVVDCLKAYQPEQIILFGSRARGDAREFSDIDLIVIKETATPYRERFRESRDYLPEMLGVDVDVIVYTPEEVEQKIEARSPFLAAVFTDGVVLYDRNPIPGAPSLKSRLKEPTMESRLHNGLMWLESARRDLRLSRLALTEEETAGGACFHAQQAIEKALKGFLIFRGLPLERTHQASELARMCVNEDHGLSPCITAAQVVEDYYISTRYPDANNVFPTFVQAQAERAVGHAENTIALVQSKIQPPP